MGEGRRGQALRHVLVLEPLEAVRGGGVEGDASGGVGVRGRRGRRVRVDAVLQTEVRRDGRHVVGRRVIVGVDAAGRDGEQVDEVADVADGQSEGRGWG